MSRVCYICEYCTLLETVDGVGNVLISQIYEVLVFFDVDRIRSAGIRVADMSLTGSESPTIHRYCGNPERSMSDSM